MAIDDVIALPKRKIAVKIITTPNSAGAVSFGEVGTAYDYCLRLALLRAHKLSHDELKKFPGFSHYQFAYRHDTRVAEYMAPHLSVIDKFLNFKLAGAKQLYAACLFLAKFDSEYRSGRPVETFSVKPQDIDELDRIVTGSTLDWAAANYAVLGPVFDSQGSKLEINADADFLLGTTLVDVKTSSTITLTENLRQLLSYYALNAISSKPLNIEHVGIFYPRFNFYQAFQVNELLSDVQQTALISLYREWLGEEISSHAARPPKFQVLKNEANVNSQDGGELSPLAIAIHCGAKDLALSLLKDGVDPNVFVADEGWTLLHSTVMTKKPDLVAMLLSADANPNVADTGGVTPLHVAIDCQLEIAKLLLTYGANPNVKDNEGSTPLHEAAFQRQSGFVDILLRAGANPNLKDNDGWTPLHIAVNEMRTASVRLLLEKEANPNAMTSKGWTPLDLALDNDSDEIAKVLVGWSAKTNAVLAPASTRKKRAR